MDNNIIKIGENNTKEFLKNTYNRLKDEYIKYNTNVLINIIGILIGYAILFGDINE